MLAIERKAKVLEYVRKQQIVTNAELAQAFAVHEATIRRDLSELEREGHLRRTHGGAAIEEWADSEPSFHERTQDRLEQKIRIGNRAAQLVADGEHLILDSGTTTLHVAMQLTARRNLTVVTNDMNVAAQMRDASGIRVLLTGGELYPSSYMLNGMFTDRVLDSLHVNKAFIGTPVLHPQHGLMHPEAQLVPAKMRMIAAARQVIVLADSSKIGKLSLHHVAPVNRIHTLITDEGVSESVVRQFEDQGVEVIIV